MCYNVLPDTVALVDCIGPIPKELAQLTSLERLDLSDNLLNGEEGRHNSLMQF